MKNSPCNRGVRQSEPERGQGAFVQTHRRGRRHCPSHCPGLLEPRHLGVVSKHNRCVTDSQREHWAMVDANAVTGEGRMHSLPTRGLLKYTVEYRL